MTSRIILKKLQFVHHLEHLETTSLAYEVYQEQKKLALPGLASEANEIMVDLEIEPSTPNSSKTIWKQLVKRKIMEKNRQDLLSRIKKNKKKLN